MRILVASIGWIIFSVSNELALTSSDYVRASLVESRIALNYPMSRILK